MKQIGLLVVFGMCSLVVPLLHSQESPPSTTAAAPSGAGWQLVQIEGNVQVKVGANADWAAAQLNQPLPESAIVRTGADGKAVIKGQDAAGVTLQANASVQVGGLSVSGTTTKAGCTAISGKSLFLINKLKSQDSSFQVETPTAVVGVRGTAFGVEVDEVGARSRVAVFTGEVSVSGKGDQPGMVIVKEKMGTNIVKNQPPSNPEALSEAEQAEWERVKTELQTITPIASVIPAIGGMVEMHQLQNAEAEKIIGDANRLIKGTKKADQDFKVFWAAMVEFYKDTGKAPTADQGLNAFLADPSLPGWKGPYLDKESNLLDPYGRPYKLTWSKSPTNKDIYEIRSGGPDGIPGNEDDHKDVLYHWKLEKLAKESKPAAP